MNRVYAIWNWLRALIVRPACEAASASASGCGTPAGWPRPRGLTGPPSGVGDPASIAPGLVSKAGGSGITDPRVEQAIDDVGDDVKDDYQGGDDRHVGHHHVDVGTDRAD